MECIRGSGSLVGPVLGGIMVAQASTSAALLIDAATLMAAPAFYASGIRRLTPKTSKTHQFLEGALAGIRVLSQDHLFGVVLPVLTIVVFATSVSDVAFIFYVRGPLESGSIAYGVLEAMWGGGFICGALAGGTSVLEGRLALSALVGAALIGVALLLTGYFRRWE